MLILGSDKKPQAQLDISSLELKDRPMLIDQGMDDGGWNQPRPWNYVFKSALLAITQQRPELRGRLHVDPTMTAQQQRKAMDVGVFETHVGSWGLILNWTTARVQQVIPARHIAVGYQDSPVAVIGPFLDGRECWGCGRGSNLRRDAGKVLPGQPCPHCQKSDWFGIVVRPAHLQRDCSEAIANSMTDRTRQERYFSHVSGDSEQQIRKGVFDYGA